MRTATLCFIIALASCRSQNAASRVTTQDADSVSYADMDPADSADTALAKPRVITGPTVLVFWIAGADTFPADDQAEAIDELNSTTESIAPTLRRSNIALVPTNSDTVYVTLPNKQRRMILLSGLDYPFGYVLIDPGAAERILARISTCHQAATAPPRGRESRRDAVGAGRPSHPRHHLAARNAAAG